MGHLDGQSRVSGAGARALADPPGGSGGSGGDTGGVEEPAGRPAIGLSYAILLALDVCARAAGFGVTILVARRFGEEGLGQVTLAQFLAEQGVVIATFGMDLLAIQSVAAGRRALGTVASTLLTLRSLAILPVFAGLALLTRLVPSYEPITVLVLLFGLRLVTQAGSLAWAPQALHRTSVFGISAFATQVVYLGLVLAGTGLAAGLWSVPAALVTAEALAAAGLLVWVLRRAGRLLPPLRGREARGFLGECAPIGLAQILRGIAINSDALILGLFLPFGQLGLYGGAHKIFLLGMGGIVSYFVVMLPNLSREAARSPRALEDELRASFRRLAPLVTLGLVAGLVLARPVLRLCYGEPFAEAAGPLRVLVLTLVLYVVGGHYRYALLAMGEQRRNMWNVLGGTAVHVAAKLLLIPALGILGASLGTLAGEAVFLGLGWWSTRAVLAERS